MASREKEIQTDIDDAEITASIEKDQKDFQTSLEAAAKRTLERQNATAEILQRELESNAASRLESFISTEAVNRGLKELTALPPQRQSKFMEVAIASL
mmetsp:Transcript_60916/g.132138  ORF Transcript_60916/g.132138 Transcript_60916/m.132138 type:complete len:98 (-) Transcript_60916:169-462(-)